MTVGYGLWFGAIAESRECNKKMSFFTKKTIGRRTRSITGRIAKSNASHLTGGSRTKFVFFASMRSVETVRLPPVQVELFYCRFDLVRSFPQCSSRFYPGGMGKTTTHLDHASCSRRNVQNILEELKMGLSRYSLFALRVCCCSTSSLRQNL